MSVNLMVPQLISEGLTKTNIGTINSINSITSALMIFPAGILADWLPVKYVLTLGTLLGGVSGLAFSQSSTYSQFVCAWSVHGIGLACCLGLMPKLVKQIADPTLLATTMSVIMTSMNVAGIVNPILNTVILQLYPSWRLGMIIYAGLLIMIGLVCHLLLPSGYSRPTGASKKTDQANSSKWHSLKRLAMNRMLWLCIMSQCVNMMTTMVVGVWGTLYFTEELSMDTYTAGMFQSVMNVGAVVGRIAIAPALDRLVVRQLRDSSDKRLPYQMIVARLPIIIGLTTLLTLCMHLYSSHISAGSSTMFVALVAIGAGVAHSGIMLAVSLSVMEIDPDNSGLCQSIMQFTIISASVLNGLPVSMFAGAYGFRAVFIVAELMCALVAVYQLNKWRLARSGDKTKLD